MAEQGVLTALLVDDDERSVDAVRAGLEAEGFRVILARTVDAALRALATAPDVVLVDLMQPRAEGLDVCRRIRACSPVPLLIHSAKAAEIDVIVGLEVGADDYLEKPVRIRELVARIRAVLRRVRPAADPDTAAETLLVVGDVRLDTVGHELYVHGRSVAVARKEFALLEVLLRAAGTVVTRETLVKRVWGPNFRGDRKTLDIQVKRIRAKIEDDPRDPKRLLTVRGLGYRYETPRRDARNLG